MTTEWIGSFRQQADGSYAPEPLPHTAVDAYRERVRLQRAAEQSEQWRLMLQDWRTTLHVVTNKKLLEGVDEGWFSFPFHKSLTWRERVAAALRWLAERIEP